MRPRIGLAGILACSVLYGGTTASPPVKVALRSSWPAPQLLLEVIETISLENPNAFFSLLDALADPENLSPLPLSPEATYQYALESAASNGFLSEPGTRASVELSLALHAATPKIEAFYQHYADAHENTPCSASWVDWYGEAVCDVETLVQLTTRETIDGVDKANNTAYTRPKILPFDHIYPSPSSILSVPPRTAIFYASIDSPNFWDFHSLLIREARASTPHIEYVFRHLPPSVRDTSVRNYLSGYGVSLDLKKMDYLALDDRHGSLRGLGEKQDVDTDVNLPAQTDPVLALLDTYPENALHDPSAALNKEEILDIGLQATQFISSSSTPLDTLKRLSQNFPAYAPQLARRVKVDTALEDELHDNQLKAQGGVNMVWLNGAVLKDTDISPLGLLRVMRKERATIVDLASLGLTHGQAVELVAHPAVGSAVADGVTDGVFDASDREEGGEVIVWWNDIEKDSRYSRWQPSLQGLLRPLYPGQFHNVKQNLFNVVLGLDLSQSSSLVFIAGPVSSIINRNFPFRWGIAPSVETEAGAQMARLFYWLVEHYGRARTMQFIKEISQVQTPHHLLTPSVDMNLARAMFDALVAPDGGKDLKADFDSIIKGSLDDSLNTKLIQARGYAERLALDLKSASQGHAFVNGKHFDMDDNFLRLMQSEVALQLQHFQELVYGGILNDTSSNISTYFYDLPTTPTRRNRHIYPSGDLRVVNLIELFKQAGFDASAERFVYPSDSKQVPLSMFVVADLDNDLGISTVKEALVEMAADSQTRVSFIHNPSHPLDDPTTERSHISWFMSHLLSRGLLSNTSPSRLLTALGLDVADASIEDSQTVLSVDATLDELTGGVKLSEVDAKEYAEYVKASRLVVRALGIGNGEQALIVNGRIVGPFHAGELVAADFKALEMYEVQKRAQPMITALQEVLSSDQTFDRSSFAHLVSMASSVVSAIQVPDPSENGLFNAPQHPRTMNYRMLAKNYTVFEFGDNATASFQVSMLLDPVSEAAQKWSSLLEWLVGVPDVFVELHLNPARYKEVPLKRFYRYNLMPRLLFDEDGLEIPAQAVFDGLPVEPIYTLGMDVPPAWLVRPREALYDLDNIQLGSLSPEDCIRGVEAVFDLDYLVVEGHAREKHTNAPPRGVQLELTDRKLNALDDTQVVANLGYLQFKTKPGVYQLGIREGRGRDIFTMESVGNEGWESPSVEEVGNEVTVTSFEGLTLFPRLTRNRGMGLEDVLADLEEPEPNPWGIVSDVVSKISSLFKSKEEGKGLAVTSNSQADINIFTVASGLLYERFVGIMILSVMRNTNSSVKFWFIENFLSPSFLEFIPHLAEAYGFQYELVTYKWPSFIRPQKEKQRIIWAYKILFLDVLFPMDLKKVIFVDADQIVRADLKELVDLDLHGAPYGYTPMGDDNPDMEGFRFWKTGYWRDFLQGRPYHISALYVVDLVRFRQIAAGDILRQQYQQLSADPNSLANLDQDLPNNLQREVPIFSLPEDWLWCETWCSKERLHRAKTIDLCQNPLTKEPKLARARQIPEWEEYDAEIARFARKLADEGLIRSQVAAADANVLANAGSTPQPSPDESETPSENVEEREKQPRDEL